MKSKYNICLRQEYNTDYVLESFIGNHICKIIFLNDNVGNILKSQVIPNIKDIKRLYPGQTYIYYPIKLVGDYFEQCLDNEEPDGYIVVSKRDYRTEHSYLKYEKIDKLKSFIDSEVTDFVKIFKWIVSEQPVSLSCQIRLNKKVIDIIDDIVASNMSEVKEEILNKTKIIDNDFDEYVKNLDLTLFN